LASHLQEFTAKRQVYSSPLPTSPNEYVKSFTSGTFLT
jgi:hypothetical protein